ncbi:uncharacterized protein BO87DRAFT_16565 [Aspergillus neoniger CBS 115656]|uniref:Uncharacterized protein n=1 Tax=Aspergillus neoniger (strain CBS 115656) TaxID=1448310 RepID=A0A318YVX8_ASPNB|nr:hypothetical protein BO87DRAFT_16565 [Aspergillus neoniger CBS 115656]PYH36060.1 hypothetical protein BO87DRAFT_16565 [Aspergillus neoniger CBS 115656]
MIRQGRERTRSCRTAEKEGRLGVKPQGLLRHTTYPFGSRSTHQPHIPPASLWLVCSLCNPEMHERLFSNRGDNLRLRPSKLCLNAVALHGSLMALLTPVCSASK